jgi:predicted RNA-binding protein
MTRFELEFRRKQHDRLRHFPGRFRAKPIALSEPHMMGMLNASQRRERIRNSLKTCFHLRLRGWPELGSILFGLT